jgi:HD superfamily phosphodiesterase
MVEHTMTVYGYALEILREEGGDSTVVGASALLHDIGIPRARELHGSSSGQYQELEGPAIAREILTRQRLPAAKIDHICGIIANHHSDRDPAIVETLEFKILWDADWMVNFPNRFQEETYGSKEEAIEEIFKTKRGKQLARQMFLE